MPTWAHLYRPNDHSPAVAKVKYYLHAAAELGEIWATERIGAAEGDRIVESVIGFIPPGKVYRDAWVMSCVSHWAAHPRSTVKADGEACNAILGITPSATPAITPTTTFLAENVDVPAAIASSWNILLLGTVPSAGGKGLGTRLIRLVLDRADEDGDGVWVPTTFEPRVRTCFALSPSFVPIWWTTPVNIVACSQLSLSVLSACQQFELMPETVLREDRV